MYGKVKHIYTRDQIVRNFYISWSFTKKIKHARMQLESALRHKLRCPIRNIAIVVSFVLQYH